MKKNINKSGRIARLVIGILSLVLSLADFFEDSFLDMALLAIGIVLIIAALVQFCPLYYFLGINTNKSKKVKMY